MRVGKSITEKEFIRTHQATSVRATFSKILLSHQIRDLTIMTPLKKGQSQEEDRFTWVCGRRPHTHV